MLDSIGQSLAKILQYVWWGLITMPIENIGNWASQLLEVLLGVLSHLSRPALRGLSNSITDNPDFDPELKASISGMLASDEIGHNFAGVFYSIFWWTGYMTSTYGIVNQDAIRHVAATYTPAIPDLFQLINLLWRHPDKKNEIAKYMAWIGFDEEQQENVLKAIKPITGVNELMQLLHRGEINKKQYDEFMGKWGYDKEEIDHLHTLGWFIPAVPDLVRMAVREVFTPEIVEKFGQMEDFPPEFAKFAKTQGLTKEWAEKYWAAHWELPSMLMGYEMLHRGVISKEDLQVLLRAKDVMPYWRDKLTAISYRPYSRVDVRRMYAFGVLDEEQVLRAYLDLGYDEEKATRMSEFTIKWTKGKDRDLSKGELISAFEEGIIEKDECKESLVAMGYSDDEAEILMERAFRKKMKQVKALFLRSARKLFLKGIYDEQAVVDRLNELNLPYHEVDELLNLWRAERKGDVRVLTIKDLKELVLFQIITRVEWEAEMRSLNYSEKHIKWLYSLYEVQG